MTPARRHATAPDQPEDTEDAAVEVLQEPTLWRQNGWTARVIKNEEDDGCSDGLLV